MKKEQQSGNAPQNTNATKGSVSRLIDDAKKGRSSAQMDLDRRVRPWLKRVAKQYLRSDLLRVENDDDIANEVMLAFLKGASDNQYDQVKDRNDLRNLLATIVRRRSINHYNKFGKPVNDRPRVGGESKFHRTDAEHVDDARSAIEQVAQNASTPDAEVASKEDAARLLSMLKDDELRQIALMRLHGLKVREIAEELGCFESKVNRKLRCIREKWQSEIDIS